MPGAPELPCFGVKFQTFAPVARAQWTGLSGETYPDRYKGGVFGCHEEVPHIAPALVPQQCEPVRVLERRAPVQLLHTPDGTPILDFGQNMAGVVRLDWQGSPGQEITLRFAEALTPDGSLYTANLRTAKATDTFVCSGGKDTFVPRFTYHGFRYVSIAGMGGNPPLDLSLIHI